LKLAEVAEGWNVLYDRWTLGPKLPKVLGAFPGTVVKEFKEIITVSTCTALQM
jgi:hypothetical protein